MTDERDADPGNRAPSAKMGWARGWLRHSSILVAAVLAAASSSSGAPSGGRPSVEAQDLARAFARAAETLRRHQSPEGYWATSVTIGPSHESARTEINVFTPAVIIDLLEPVARETGLTSALARGRGYLRRQVEPSGLVRYHGAAGPAPADGRGCELPPDADDTALVWRIAPPAARGGLAAASREIGRYMDGEGLYRTWLADEGEYRCFYMRFAGTEWNPPDVAVEMHVYLFLARHDPAAAARLCDALRRRLDDDRIWVWYTVAPLLPVLREVDLARKGCGLRVPQGRVDRAVPGQAPYLTQARLLVSLLLEDGAKGGGRPSPEPYLQALRDGAADGFARLSEAPPLLFHNDLSAAPPHYHWSEDFGYALWLRLYVETARRFPGALPPLPRPAARR